MITIGVTNYRAQGVCVVMISGESPLAAFVADGPAERRELAAKLRKAADELEEGLEDANEGGGT